MSIAHEDGWLKLEEQRQQPSVSLSPVHHIAITNKQGYPTALFNPDDSQDMERLDGITKNNHVHTRIIPEHHAYRDADGNRWVHGENDGYHGSIRRQLP